MKKAIHILAFLMVAAPLWASHGAPASRDRDAWIDGSLRRLVETGWLPPPGKPFASFTNDEVAEQVARASERFLAQVPAPEGSSQPASDAPKAAPAGAGDLKALVLEYRREMRRMLVNLLALERRFLALPRGTAVIRDLLLPYANRTGTELTGYSRGYLNTRRAYGSDNAGQPIERIGAIFVDLRFRSLPAPNVLFEADVRGWNSIGFIYAEPISPTLEVRRLSLTAFTENAVFSGGDFEKSLSRLVLWNPDPVHQPVEPTPFKRRRMDLEDLMMVDRAPDWRLRGMDLTLQVEPETLPVLDRAWMNGFGGPIRKAGAQTRAAYFAGGRAGVTGLDGRLTLAGNALALWDDVSSANAAYFTVAPATWPRQQWAMSFDPSASVTVAADVALDARAEVARSVFVDDVWAHTPAFRVVGWAGLGNLVVRSRGVSLTADYHDVRPEYYAPGSQTLRYTPGSDVPGYQPINVDDSKDWGIGGYRNRFLFQSFGRPAFAPYALVAEMIFPYGDATPNRKAVGGGLGAGVGKNGWVKPRLRYTKASEIRPNWVREVTGTQDVAVDFNTTTATARTFTGLEGALVLSLKEPLPSTGLQTFLAGYKSQESEFAGGGLKVDTLTLGLDAVPPVAWLDKLLCSLAYAKWDAKGDEFSMMSGALNSYSYRYDTSPLGTYVRGTTGSGSSMTTLAAGLKYTVNSSLAIRGDWYGSAMKYKDLPEYDFRNDEWRVTYEAAF